MLEHFAIRVNSILWEIRVSATCEVMETFVHKQTSKAKFPCINSSGLFLLFIYLFTKSVLAFVNLFVHNVAVIFTNVYFMSFVSAFVWIIYGLCLR